MRNNIFHPLLGVIIALLLSSCNGLFEDIYDQPVPEERVKYGFTSYDEKTHVGRIYIDACDYTQWHYVDLHNKQVSSTYFDDLPPESWDFAIHRYDAKTNNASVVETNVNTFDLLSSIGTLIEDKFEADQWTTDRIATDMSQMLSEIIVYTPSYCNLCLSKWLDVDISIMPPIYTLSKKVYILKLADDTYAALKLINFMNDSARKGYMTIDYIYPIEL